MKCMLGSCILAVVCLSRLAMGADHVAQDETKAEDVKQLAEAMKRMEHVRPVRSRSGLRHQASGQIKLVRFSHDGKLLATAGYPGEIRLWNTNDWSEAAVIHQDGSIYCLRFSPDDRFLYVAGGGGEEVHARFDTHTGKRDKAYQGHHDAILSLELSPDGKTMVTSSYFEKVMHFWDTESGQILRTIPLSNHNSWFSHFLLSPDGKGIVRAVKAKPIDTPCKTPQNETEWVFEPFRGDKDGHVCFHTNCIPPKTLGFSRPIAYYAYRTTSTFGRGGQGYVVSGRWDSSGLHEPDSRDIGVSGVQSITVSKDGKLLAAVGSNNTVWILSLPTLKPVAKATIPRRAYDSLFDCSIEFSPDNKILAIGADEPTPLLIRVESGERLLPYEGHGGKPLEVFFADDNRLISYGSDNTICTWDAATMKMLRRVELPYNYTWKSVREPDGKYAICFSSPSDIEPFGGSGDANHPLRVYDVDRSAFVAKAIIPNGFLYWIDDREAVAVDTPHGKKPILFRFNYRNGKILSTLEVDGKWHGEGELTEDRQHVFILPVIRHEGPGTPVAPAIANLVTGKITHHQSANPEWIRIDLAYLVPGGKYFCLAEPNIYIYDRRTLKQISKKMLKDTYIYSLSFSKNGHYYALASIDRKKWDDPKIPFIISIHDTLSGKPLLAFPASTCSGRVKFAPDGKRLAVINIDGTIEVWNLPKY